MVIIDFTFSLRLMVAEHVAFPKNGMVVQQSASLNGL